MRPLLLPIALCGLLLCCHAAPAETLPPPDITVAADGSGDFTTVEKAVQSIPKDNHQRVVVLIKDGTYKEKVRLDASCVTLRGQSRAGTRIEFPQLNDDYDRTRDDIGRAVVNINGDDAVLENITVVNTANVIGPHEFAVYGTGDRTVIIDSDILSEGADTVSIWHANGGFSYHARCNFRGSVDFVCPRGWCYATDCTFYEMKNTAAVWNDGHFDKDQKFVLHDCKFDGAAGWNLARHHHDAQFYFLDCTFSKTMIDRAPFRVIYPLSATQPTTADTQRNKDLDKTNLWGERAYYSNCHREGGDDYGWFKDNLSAAPGAPTAQQITAAWTFAGKWNPETATGPSIRQIVSSGHQITLEFDGSVTVKGKPRLVLAGGGTATYASGSGSAQLLFDAPPGSGAVQSVDLNGGWIIASQAGAALRPADLALPAPGK